MLERDIEKHLVKRCKELEIGCEKFTSPSRRSVPDRILTYRSTVVFVELKAPGKVPTPAQERDHEKRIHNACVVWTDSIEGVEQIVRCIVDRCPIPFRPGFKVAPLVPSHGN